MIRFGSRRTLAVAAALLVVLLLGSGIYLRINSASALPALHLLAVFVVSRACRVSSRRVLSMIQESLANGSFVQRG